MSKEEDVKINVMLDLETTSTEIDGGILVIAAVPFMWDESLEPYYGKVAMADLEKEGRKFSRSTMDWWKQQPVAVRTEAFSGTHTLAEQMQFFADWMNYLPAPAIVWGNGADFDNAMMIDSLDHCGITVPWEYRDNRCYRTMRKLFPQVPHVFIGDKHNALVDAQNQAAHAINIFNYIERLERLNNEY